MVDFLYLVDLVDFVGFIDFVALIDLVDLVDLVDLIWLTSQTWHPRAPALAYLDVPAFPKLTPPILRPPDSSKLDPPTPRPTRPSKLDSAHPHIFAAPETSISLRFLAFGSSLSSEYPRRNDEISRYTPSSVKERERVGCNIGV